MDKFLTEEEKLLLSKEDLTKYKYAVACINDGWANGPYGGWVRGNAALQELGWTSQKPKKYTLLGGSMDDVYY